MKLTYIIGIGAGVIIGFLIGIILNAGPNELPNFVLLGLVVGIGLSIRAKYFSRNKIYEYIKTNHNKTANEYALKKTIEELKIGIPIGVCV